MSLTTQKIGLMLITILSPYFLLAQGPEDPGGDPGVPFDGGASIAISAVAIFAIKKYRDRKKQKSLKL